jgi:hypothetical protein
MSILSDYVDRHSQVTVISQGDARLQARSIPPPTVSIADTVPERAYPRSRTNDQLLEGSLARLNGYDLAMLSRNAGARSRTIFGMLSSRTRCLKVASLSNGKWYGLKPEVGKWLSWKDVALYKEVRRERSVGYAAVCQTPS